MSILDKLEKDRVFSVSPLKDGGVYIVECCDYYYSSELTKEELLQLAEEIKAMAERGE